MLDRNVFESTLFDWEPANVVNVVPGVFKWQHVGELLSSQPSTGTPFARKQSKLNVQAA